MEYRILGPLEVADEGEPVPLGRLKERVVLAVLLLHPNEFVSRERLIDELWGPAPPATARKAVNVYISKLRQTLTRDGHDPPLQGSCGAPGCRPASPVGRRRFDVHHKRFGRATGRRLDDEGAAAPPPPR